MNDLSFSSSSPTLLCDIKRHIHGKSFSAERTPPPQLPISAHKKQVEKRMASVGEVWGGGGVHGGRGGGGSWREMIDRDIYMCV